ncbi:hypothetical protein TEA_026253 [Camellia sinensis var. sinensis]|uniref:RING-type E3 ubiquitin transferase n=1 Tax=Camellia sinensis var. sinensis TaxID=542762 RepID=A0A4S4DLS7_CAMSN|nr:hypothetical protein TEA_026253 [Camellia sinensis var. sinensis]
MESESDVVKELMEVIETLGSFVSYRRTQRKECLNLVRRLKLLVPLLEELKDQQLHTPISDEALNCLANLKKALRYAKKLLMMSRFHGVYDKLNQALDDMPYEKLGISEEVKEQVELMCMQLKRAKRRTDTQDIELAMDMMVVFSENDDRNADNAILERLAIKLELHTIADLKTETIAVRKLVNKKGAHTVESNKKIVDLLEKFIHIAGIEEISVLDNPVSRSLEKCRSLLIPNEFLCPITLEIMTDPVIVATGQLGLAALVEGYQQVCALFSVCFWDLRFHHLRLRRYHLLRRSSHLPLTEFDASLDAESSNPGNQIFEKLISGMYLGKNGTDEARENSAATLFSLSMLDENKVMIGCLNGIPPLVDLLRTGTIRGKKDAATALFNLSLNMLNKSRAIKAGIVPPLLHLLEDKNLGMVDEALSILLLLASHPEGRNEIGKLALIETLVEIIRVGTPKNKECATAVLLELGLKNSSFVLAALQYGVYDHLAEIARCGTSRAQRKANSLLQHMSNCEHIPRETTGMWVVSYFDSSVVVVTLLILESSLAPNL